MFFVAFDWLFLNDFPIRNLLIKAGYWGAADEPTRVHLHRAYLDFKRWCSSKRIQCSQAAFREKFVPSGLALAIVFQVVYCLPRLFILNFCVGISYFCGTNAGQTELYQTNGDILLVCKAYNGRVVAQWLGERVAAASQQQQFVDADETNTIAMVAVAMFLVQVYDPVCLVLVIDFDPCKKEFVHLLDNTMQIDI